LSLNKLMVVNLSDWFYIVFVCSINGKVVNSLILENGSGNPSDVVSKMGQLSQEFQQENGPGWARPKSQKGGTINQVQFH